MRRRRAVAIALYAVLASGACLVVLPFAVMLRTALVPEREALGGSWSMHQVTLDNFRAAFASADWLQYYRNSLIVTISTFVLQVMVCLPAGYALARVQFRARRAMYLLTLACLVIPPQVTAIPSYVLLTRLGLGDTLLSLILPSIGSAFGIYLFRQFILTIPASVFDAARLDGVRGLDMVWRVVLPNVRPALLAFGVFSVVSHWNDLFWPSVMLRGTQNATVPYGIALFSSLEQGAHYGAQMAAASLALVPLVVAFIVAQRQFVSGIVLGTAAD
jgi:multiple sugar transport system permease protein